MSRTDAHAPLLVRIARRELAAVACHGSHDPEPCDLIALGLLSRAGQAGRQCTWTWSYTGEPVCCCPLCHLGYLNRAENRRDRHATRTRLAAALSAWRAGDREAFDR